MWLSFRSRVAANASKNNKKRQTGLLEGGRGRLIEVTNAAFYVMSEKSGVAA